MQGSTLVDDASGLTITSHGTNSYTASSPGPARQFGGADGDYLSVDSFPNTALPLTIGCFWRLSSSLGGSGVAVLASMLVDSSKYLLLQVNNSGQIQATATNFDTSTSGSATNGGPFSYNTWYMSAAVFTSSTSRAIYQSGAGLSSANTTSVDCSGSAMKLTIAAHPSGGVESVPGFEKYVFVIGRALTQTELDAIAADPTTLVGGVSDILDDAQTLIDSQTLVD